MAEKLDKVDVVIVGAGWAGGITAAELTKAGYKVVGLERGKDQEISDFVGAKDSLRYDSRYGMMEDNSVQTITGRRNEDEEAIPLRTQSDNYEGSNVGGSGSHWSGVTHRATAFDFEVRSKTIEKYGEDKIPKDMFLQDWGITYDEIEPYYDKFEKMAGTSGEEDPLGAPRSSPYPTPPMKETPAIKLFKDAAKKLGYHPFQIPSANLSQQYENPDGQTINACQYCAFCVMYGCDFGAKSDPLVTVIPTALETGNYDLRTHAYTRRVLHENGKATGVLYVDMKSGKEYEQPADVVILAAYTLSNTKLMLLSDIGEPYDPKTKSGVIGRNAGGFTGSSKGTATGFFENKKFNLAMGAGALGGTFSDLDSDNLDTTDLDFIGGGIVELRLRGEDPINYNTVPKDTPRWGKEFKEKSLHYANRNLTAHFKAPNYGWSYNYMDLDPTYKDSFNDPLLRVTMTLTDHEKKLRDFGRRKMAEVMEEMGADIVEMSDIPDDWEFGQSGGEAGGGVIMGNDPEISAVNNYLQVWDMENLFVVGASALPQKIPQQTATVGAFAYRAAEGVEKYLKDGGGMLAEAKSKTRKV